MRISAPMFLSFNGGYVDTVGFLALNGLFTAHVTGNFVTLAAALVHGSDAAAKLLALPVFCVVAVIARMLSLRLQSSGLSVLRAMLIAQVVLLALAAASAIAWWPLDVAGWRGLLTGMTLVSAMAIQNVAHRVHLGFAPPSTLMTGTSTQMMIDIAELMNGKLAAQERSSARARLVKMARIVCLFAGGCTAAALLFLAAGRYAFVVPSVVAILAIFGPAENTNPAQA